MLQQQFVVFWADYVLDYFLTGPSYTKLTGMKFPQISSYSRSVYWMVGCGNVFKSTSQRLETSSCRYRLINTVTVYSTHLWSPTWWISFITSHPVLTKLTCRRLNVKHSEAWNVHPVKRSHIKTMSESTSPLHVTITVRDKNLVDFLISN